MPTILQRTADVSAKRGISIYRVAVVGLLGMIAAAQCSTHVFKCGGPRAFAYQESRPRDVIVDVSRRAPVEAVTIALGLRPGERVIAIGDVRVQGDALADAWRTAAPGDYLDLTVADRDDATFRTLVLVHP